MITNNYNLQYRYAYVLNNCFLYKNNKYGLDFRKARIFNRKGDLKQSSAYRKNPNGDILLLALVNPDFKLKH